MAILNDLLNTALIKRVIGRFDMRYILYHMPFIMTAYDWRKNFTVCPLSHYFKYQISLKFILYPQLNFKENTKPKLFL